MTDPDTNMTILDLSNLRMITDGDTELEKELVRLFVDQVDKSLLVLEDYCVDGESKTWKETAHMIKGGAANIGATTLHSLCERAQQMYDGTASERSLILSQIRENIVLVKKEFTKIGLL